jgi:nitrogen regulatory protein P-II 1
MTKKIEAVVRAERMNDVKDALYRVGILGMNIVRVHGHGRTTQVASPSQDTDFPSDMLRRVQFNIVLSDHNVEQTIKTICQAAYTGEPGDGLIFVYPVEQVVRIRTGERGRQALKYKGDIDEQSEQAWQAELVGVVSGPLLPEP